MSVAVVDEPVEIALDITNAESSALFDSVCQYYLSMSGQEFIDKWNRGAITFEDGEDNLGVSRVIAVLPFAA